MPRRAPGRAGGRKPPAERSTAARAIISVVIVLVLAAVGVAAWSISRSLHRSAAPTTPSRSHSSSPTVAAAVPLKPVGVSSFDSGGGEDPGGAQYAIDGNAGTFWHTSYYLGSPLFGGLPKKGTGLILDMGKQVRLSQVMVQFGATCCTRAEVEIGNSNTPSAATLGTFTPVQSSTTAHGSTTFNVTKQTAGRYVLIWITDLPPLAGSPGRYEALIYDITVRGFAASQ